MHILNGSTDNLKGYIRDEIEFPGNISKSGGKSMKARRVQEWLCLHGNVVVVDGEFGEATARAVRDFQLANGLEATGVVDEATFEALVAPLKRVLRPQVDAALPLGEAMVAIAQAHLKEHPREVGTVQNSGPWVRFYMRGNSGPDWLWCAGFVTLIMKQAAEVTSRPMPIDGSFSCDLLATQAMAKDIFVKESAAGPDRVPPGSLFLVRRVSGDWIHTGIVARAEPDVFRTIEGNTNDGGSSNGIEACARTRGYEKKDFVAIQ
jgi:hypothetical protein